MPDQPHHLPQAPERVQRLILRLLLEGEQERLWPLEVVVRHVGDQITALNALVALSDAGLVHRWGRYVIPTRAAMHFYWLPGNATAHRRRTGHRQHSLTAQSAPTYRQIEPIHKSGPGTG